MTVTTKAITVKRQHKKPCHDCPWRREAMPGWLGKPTADEWLSFAHGEAFIECHTRKFENGQGPQCAGAAIYRSNVCKSVHDSSVLRLPADRERVFAMPMEFKAHHAKGFLK